MWWYESCKDSIFSNIDNIYAWGNNSLGNTTITSNGAFNNSNKLSITIHEDIFDQYYIICTFNDDCFIDCQSKNACLMLILQCNGACYVRCGDEQGMFIYH